MVGIKVRVNAGIVVILDFWMALGNFWRLYEPIRNDLKDPGE